LLVDRVVASEAVEVDASFVADRVTGDEAPGGGVVEAGGGVVEAGTEVMQMGVGVSALLACKFHRVGGSFGLGWPPGTASREGVGTEKVAKALLEPNINLYDASGENSPLSVAYCFHVTPSRWN